MIPSIYTVSSVDKNNTKFKTKNEKRCYISNFGKIYAIIVQSLHTTQANLSISEVVIRKYIPEKAKCMTKLSAGLSIHC